MKLINFLKLNIVLVFCYVIKTVNCATPTVVYGNIGDTVRIQCTTGGGSYVCFSTYTFQNSFHSMVVLNNTLKYQIASGGVTVNNVQATDAGFYACSSNCDQIKSDQISSFLQPISMNQLVDTSKNWVPIPPLPESDAGVNPNQLYVVVSDERLNAAHHGRLLSDGEIAGLVVGLFLALVITIAVVVFLCILNRRRKAKRDDQSAKRSDKDSTVDYSTIERDYDASANNTLSKDGNRQLADRDGEKRSLSTNKSDISNLVNVVAETINTRNIKGPGSYKPSSNDVINQQDLPNIDIFNKPGSQRSQQPLQPQQNMSNRSFNNQGSYNAPTGNIINPPNRSYQNQLDPPYEEEKIQSMRSDIAGNAMLPPPPNRSGQGKIQFPSRNQANQQQQQQPQQRYVSNENIHLKQIIKESGFITDLLDDPYNNQQQIEQPDNERPQSSRIPKLLQPTQLHQTGGIDLDLDLDADSSRETNNGGVTVVSARTPVRSGEQPTLNVLPTATNRSIPPPNKYSFNNQNVNQNQNQNYNNNNNKPPHLSLSQRIETTSTPLQIAPPSASLRTGVGYNKDGATDV